jgi:hypothetical protein
MQLHGKNIQGNNCDRALQSFLPIHNLLRTKNSLCKGTLRPKTVVDSARIESRIYSISVYIPHLFLFSRKRAQCIIVLRQRRNRCTVRLQPNWNTTPVPERISLPLVQSDFPDVTKLTPNIVHTLPVSQISK